MVHALKRIFFILVCFNYYISAQHTVLTESNIFDLETVAEYAVSPDGLKAVFTKNVIRKFNDDPGPDYRELYLIDLITKEIRALLTGSINVMNIQWSGRNTIYYRSAVDKKQQIYAYDLESDKSKQLTRHANSILQYKVSGDGTTIFFTSNELRDKRKPELKSAGFDAEIFEEDYDDITLYSFSLTTSETKKLTNDITVFDFQLSPDEKFIAIQAGEKNLTDYSYMFKDIYLLDLSEGKLSLWVDVPGKLSGMSWSSDSKKLAFIAGSDANDPVSGSLYVIEDLKEKKFNEILNLTEGFEGSVKEVQWKSETELFQLSEESTDNTLVERNIRDKSAVKKLISGKGTLHDIKYTGKALYMIGNTPSHPNELMKWKYDSTILERLTKHNSWLDSVYLSRQEIFAWKADDGLRLEGLLIYPKDYTSDKKYPLIVYIHGGPEACVSNGWVTSYGSWGQIAAAQGYFVFMPNYRASSGRGVAFAKMDRGDLAGAEFNDVLDGIDELIKQGKVDENKVGIGGGSYGGYFSAWAATKHTKRFAASVVFVGVTNQISKSLSTDIPNEDYLVHWGIWPHENFQLYLDRSPVAWAKGSVTPTLILHGKEDPRVPPLQSLELYRSLKLHGKAPVRLVLYPGEGHGNRKNTSRFDFILRTMQWFNYYLKNEGPVTEMPDKYLNVMLEE